MKNVTRIIAVLVVIALGIGAYFTLKDQNGSKADFKKEDSDFSVANTSSLSMIFIADRNERKHKFVKQTDGRWLINDDYYAATHMMELLLTTLEKMKVKNPVPAAARNTVIKNLAIQGIKVELYNESGILKTFYVGGTTSDDLGTYFIMDKSENPYVVHIPGFNGFLTSRFQIKKHNWVDRLFFKCPKSQLESIALSYTTDSMQSFTVRRNTELDSLVIEGLTNPDDMAINKYISYFASTHIESFVENEKQLPILDSLKVSIPFCKIELKSTDHFKNRSLTLYPFKSLDRMYGITQNGELVTVQYYNFQKLMVSKSFFQKRTVIL